MTSQIYIPERFARVITLHVIKNMLPSISRQVPLILGIHGPSGYGKTYQCEYVLQHLGVRVFLISGGQLESERAGEPARLIRAMYLNASTSIMKGEALIAAVMINDLDAGVGSFGNMVQYTVNRQQIFAELMHLVDYPQSVEGIATERIPIIVTGNDFTKLYGPVVRPGRMTSFRWIPTPDEKSAVIGRLFPELSEGDCRRLVKEFADESVAFFSTLRSTLVDDALYEEILKKGPGYVIRSLRGGADISVSSHIRYDSILQHGRALQQAKQHEDHLGG